MGNAAAGDSAAELLLRAAALVPPAHYALAALLLACALLYRFLELHLIGDLLRGLRGGRVALTFHPASHVYHRVASKCRSLHGRYLATPWLASPHLQTLFLSISGRPPSFTYRRQLYTVRDGGTIALDWLLASDCEEEDVGFCDGVISRDDSTPLVVVIPGLTSDSTAAYVKHLVFSMASKGWNVVVGNHRGLGGISITSDCFYNAGWTEDFREIVNYLHQKYPQAPLFAVGTSIGANILVKYLGEEGEGTPVAGAVSICSPWDLLVTNRFIQRKLVQRCYDKALAIGLKGYAKLHQPVLARLANWEDIRKSRSIREFDRHATCVVAKYECDGNRSQENVTPAQGPVGSQEQPKQNIDKIQDAIAPVKISINQLIRSQGRSVWLLTYIAFVTSWPFLGALGFILFRKKFRNSLPAKRL
ncbi:hypothetical protein DAI22_05g171900 [Oryza sativa Japonica Group]|nr:hypothetical protein DAI22_05g171900 [Oryza sativa Japonica Group]